MQAGAPSNNQRRRRPPRRNQQNQNSQNGGNQERKRRQASEDQPASNQGKSQRSRSNGNAKPRNGQSSSSAPARKRAEPGRSSNSTAAQQANRSRSQSSKRQRGRGRRGSSAPAASVIPNLSDWCFELRGYVFWMAFNELYPPMSDGRNQRAYIVDVHAGEDEVDPQYLPEIVELKPLFVTGHSMKDCRKLLEAMVAEKLEAIGLIPVEEYMQRLPVVVEAEASEALAPEGLILPMDSPPPEADNEN